ncbi:MAG TPA: phosphoglycolate phosphatase [Paracoccaceae bacterium]|nr:phosphoglycolate phosphatase [Paracoccaceae bacterium]HMO70793.1 phosphoglycolate phosphatase [Paracoccaceae bacterium]
MMRIVFDLDGTLIDSAPDIHANASRVLAEEGLAPMTLAEVRGMIGHGVPHLVGRLLEASGQDPAGARFARMVDSFAAGYEGAVGLTRTYPGVEAALAALAGSGAPLGICTNKPRAPTLSVLRHLGLSDRFAVVVGGDSLPVRKPDPAPLLAALAALGQGPAVYVGDSEVDAETAAAAGLPFLLYTEGYRRAPVTALPHAAAFADWGALPYLVARLA